MGSNADLIVVDNYMADVASCEESILLSKTVIKLDPGKEKNWFMASCVKRQLLNFCSHFSEKASKGRFLRPEKLQNHSNEGEGKGKKKERGEGKEGKSSGCTLSFIIATLAITLSKIRLDTSDWIC